MTTDTRANRPTQRRGWGPGLHHNSAVLFQGEVTIHYNKLQADPKQGMSLDIGSCAGAVASRGSASPVLSPCDSASVVTWLCPLTLRPSQSKAAGRTQGCSLEPVSGFSCLMVHSPTLPTACSGACMP